jgi:hypothetical protein
MKRSEKTAISKLADLNCLGVAGEQRAFDCNMVLHDRKNILDGRS